MPTDPNPDQNLTVTQSIPMHGRAEDAGSPSVSAGAGADTRSGSATSPPVSAETDGDTRSRPAASPPHADHPQLPSVPGYAVAREIARGGMAVVYVAHDPVFDRQVAVKVMHPGQDAARFVVESRLTAQLPHPGVPPVYALGTADDGRPFLAMKLVEGRTLADELRAKSRADLPRLVGAFEQICLTVGFAHACGIVHRDLKPSNVMLGAFGEVLVMDWGLAKHIGEQPADGALGGPAASGASTIAETVGGQIKGTPAYMAPEQARGESVDTGFDVFALGGILCAILTGKAPFGGTSVPDTVRKAAAAELDDARVRLDQCGADGELVAIAKRALAPVATDRYATGSEVAAAVVAYRANVERRLREADRARATAEAEAVERRKRRRVLRGLIGASGVAAVALVGLAVGGVYSARLSSAYTAETDARAQAEDARFAEEGQRKAAEAARAAEEAQRKAAEAARAKEQEQRKRAEAAKSEEEKQRQLAEGAKNEEEKQRQLAEEARRAAEDARDALDRALNLTKVFLAGAALQDHNAAQAQQRLSECRPEFRRWDWYYLDAQNRPELLSVRHPNPSAGARVAFSSDGERLILTSPASTAIVYDAWTGQKVARPEALAGLTDVAFSPDGTRLAAFERAGAPGELLRLATASVFPPVGGAPTLPFSALGDPRAGANRHLQLFDARTGARLAQRPLPAYTNALVFSTDGNRLVAELNGGVRAYDGHTGAELFASKDLSSAKAIGQQYCALSPDGTRAAFSTVPELTLFDTRTGAALVRIKTPELVHAPAFTPDGKRVVGSGPSGTVYAFDVRTGREEQAFGTPNRLPRLVLSPDGARVAAAPWNDGVVRVYDLKTGKPVETLKLPPFAGTLPTFGPDGTRLAAIGPDGAVQLFDARAGGEPVRLVAPVRQANAAFSPDGTRVAAIGADGLVRVYDARPVSPHLSFGAGQFQAVTLTPDGKQLLVQVSQPRDRMNILSPAPWDAWRVDLQTGSQIRLFGAPNVSSRVAFSPDGGCIAFTSALPDKPGDPGATSLHDARTGQRTSTINGHVFPTNAFSPDGALVQTVSADNTVRVYETKTGNQLCAIAIRRKIGFVLPLPFSPDGGRCADRDEDGVIHVFDVRTGREVLTVKAPGPLYWPLFHPDGTRLVAGGDDGVIRLFDARDGREVGTIRAAEHLLLRRLSPDGTRLVAAGGRTLRVFDGATGRELFALPVGNVLFGGPTFTPDGDRLVVCDGAGDLRMFDARTGQETVAPKLPDKRAVNAGLADPDNLSFSRDGTWLMFRTPEGAHLWDAPRDPVAHQTACRQRVRAALRAWHDQQFQEHMRADYNVGTAVHLGRLCELEPANGQLHLLRGIILNRLGRTDEAKRAYRAALALKATLPEGVEAFAHAGLDEWEEATSLLARAIRIPNAWPSTWSAYSLLKLRAGDQAGYPKLCAEAIERLSRTPTPQIRYALASLCAQAPNAVADYAPVIGWARAAVAAAPRDALARSTLGAVLYRAGLFKEAAAELLEAVKSSADRPSTTTYLFLAMTYHRLGETAEARRWLSRADDGLEADSAADWEARLEQQVLRAEAGRALPELAPAPHPTE